MRQKTLAILVAFVSCMLFAACGNNEEQRKQADQLIDQAYKAKDMNRLTLLADSLMEAGSLSQAKGYYWLGYASDRMGKKRIAEFYWKASLKAASTSSDSEDADIYAKTASRLANLLCVEGELDNALETTKPVAKHIEELQRDTTSDYVNLLVYIGCCQIGTNSEEAMEKFDKAYKKHLDFIEKSHTDETYKNAIAGLINMAFACNESEHYQDALTWTKHFGELIGDYEQRNDADRQYVDKQVARFAIYQAIALQGLNMGEEAEKVYQQFKDSEFSKTPEGKIAANEYLTAAKRWDEASDNYSSLNALLIQQKMPYTLDNINKLLLKKYEANVTAGRRDSASVVSMQICNALNQALSEDKKLKEEEQATMMKNVEKITMSEAEKAKQEKYIWNALVVLLFLAFIGYALYKWRAGKKLVEAHKALKKDYNQLAGTTADKERAATEQRIASAIGKTVSEATAPAHQHITSSGMYIVGEMAEGCLCETLVRDEKLLFCIGDAAANGVEAAVTTALAKTQFRMAAAYEDTPARLMAAIDGAGEKIKLLTGVLDLNTGQLTYQNAGHHAPLLIGEDIQKLNLEETEATLASGTMLLLYNEGFIKAENASQKAMGENRMLGDVLQAAKLDASPKAFIENMRQALERYISGQQQNSDITMLAMKWTS